MLFAASSGLDIIVVVVQLAFYAVIVVSISDQQYDVSIVSMSCAALQPDSRGLELLWTAKKAGKLGDEFWTPRVKSGINFVPCCPTKKEVDRFCVTLAEILFVRQRKKLLCSV